jgi:hypothetical protein
LLVERERECRKAALQKWMREDEDEVEVVGEGEGIFQGYAPSYVWLLVPSPATINGIEECWQTTFEVEKRNQGRGEWRAPGEVG